MDHSVEKSTRMAWYVAILGALVIFVVVLPGYGQGFEWPETTENLKVLPVGTSGTELGDIMRGFSLSLGVDCSHCHVGEGRDLTRFDFAADEKEPKRIARQMIEMVREINQGHIANVSDDPLQVRCITCHRGQDKPWMIEEVMRAAIESEGAEGAVAKYRELREEHYGGFTFDFSEGVLPELARDLARGRKIESAVALVELNLEFYPESVATWYAKGSILALAGRREEAVEAMGTALELAPERQKDFIQSQIDRLFEAGLE